MSRWIISLHQGPPVLGAFSQTEVDYVGYARRNYADDFWDVRTKGEASNAFGFSFPRCQNDPLMAVRYFAVTTADGEYFLPIMLGAYLNLFTGLTPAVPKGGLHLSGPEAVRLLNELYPDASPSRVDLPVINVVQENWRAWRDVLTKPGECPCGVPRAVCTYHRDAA